MKTPLWTAIAVLVPVMLLAQSSTGVANGNGTDQGTVQVPDTSKENSADVGRKAHTNHLILMRASARQSYLSGLTPADIGRAYNVSPSGAGVIAIVDAYHYPTASADLAHFASGQGVTGFAAIAPLNACPTGGPTGTTACFWQVWVDPATGGLTTDTKKMPPTNCGWNQEAALDIQWAHAMAPNASIVLVEAQSNSFSDLFAAVRVATGLTGARQVSMSWGGSEFSTEAYYDQYFPPGNVVYIASSGDTGGKTIYPSVSPYVLAAGGTTLNMSGSRGSATLKSETGWSGSGGGTSTYEPAAPFQDVIRTKVGNARGVPDLSFDADPNTGVLVYGPSCSGTNASTWLIFGGTSVSAPALSGILNSAAVANNPTDLSTGGQLSRVYGLTCDATTMYPAQCRDIISGRAARFAAASGWDFVTGMGTPVTFDGK